ncbi:hypothetical protein JKP88DRAFT_280905 [Tribonema minus]|uniref:Uncharacterized protein n=1 Tax=Tribonema minus TaxID=303371 RepID=A0A835YNV2_9STRA|nr:hypothetical protein JKP88DRAFT_280905 [Tribonema minus]
MVATLEPRNEASGDVLELGVAESTLGELTLMCSRSSDGGKPTPRIVQVIDYGESASQPLLHADDHVPSSSSCHSTTRLSGDGSAFVPHDSAGTGTGDGDSTVLNGGLVVAEQCSASCNNICEAAVLSSDCSACVRHESAGTGDRDPAVLNCVRHESAGTGVGDPTVLNGGDSVAEQCSTSCNNSCEAPALSNDGSTFGPRSLEGSDVGLALVPCESDVMPAAGVPHLVFQNSSMALAAGTTALFNISHAKTLPRADGAYSAFADLDATSWGTPRPQTKVPRVFPADRGPDFTSGRDRTASRTVRTFFLSALAHRGPDGEVRPNKDFEAADWKEVWTTGEVRTHNVVVSRGGGKDVRPMAHTAVMRQKTHGDMVARGFEDKEPNVTGKSAAVAEYKQCHGEQ